MTARRGVDWATGKGSMVSVQSAGDPLAGTVATLTVELDCETHAVVTGRLVYQGDTASIEWDQQGREHLPALRWCRVQTIKRVHVISMNHLDVSYNDNGFHPRTGYINTILNRYFQVRLGVAAASCRCSIHRRCSGRRRVHAVLC